MKWWKQPESMSKRYAREHEELVKRLERGDRERVALVDQAIKNVQLFQRMSSQIRELNRTIDEDRSLIMKLTEIMNKKGTSV